MQELDTLVELVVKEGASDLHLSAGRSPFLRISSVLIPLNKYPELSDKQMEAIVNGILTDAKKEVLKNKQSVDFSYSHKTDRFRVHIFIEQQRINMVLRHIPKRIPTLQELGLPDYLQNFARLKSGFFLVVGPVGQGKSTTIASLLDVINNERLENIITIEDPVEYMFVPNKSIIHQREVGIDSPSFAEALHDSFRADVNVIMVGEMRDAETMKTAVTAAETGHLVFSTLHTNNAAQTVDRIIDSFDATQQNQIRLQLSSSLSGIFSQRLIPKISGGLTPAYELMLNNTAVANLIREKRTHEINTIIETGSGIGMIDFNRCLVDKVNKGEITVENAYLYSNNPKTLEKML